MENFEHVTQTAALQSDAAAILAAGAAMMKIRKDPTCPRRAIALVPPDYSVHELDEPDYPSRPRGTAKMRDVKSFIDLYNRQKQNCSLVYATLDPARFLAVIDDHFPVKPSNILNEDFTSANWQEYRIDFTVPASHEWKVWTQQNRKPMSQLEFATFIEDNLPDIVEPSGSDMLTIALNFEASKDGRFVSNTRLDNGEVEFLWKENIESNVGAQKIQMPPKIRLAIPVFENGELVDVNVRIKFRIVEQSLKIWYEIAQQHKIIDRAFREIWDEIERKTKASILLGMPE